MALLDLPSDAMIEDLADWQWRFWEKVSFDDECWIWHGARQTSGYGHFNLDGRSVGSHRIAYEMLVGPIPERLTLDHVKSLGCTSKACVRPDHLEAVTHRVNNGRSDSRSALNARKTECQQGHPFDNSNTYLYKGGRQCKACRAAALREMRKRNAHS